MTLSLEMEFQTVIEDDGVDDGSLDVCVVASGILEPTQTGIWVNFTTMDDTALRECSPPSLRIPANALIKKYKDIF